MTKLWDNLKSLINKIVYNIRGAVKMNSDKEFIEFLYNESKQDLEDLHQKKLMTDREEQILRVRLERLTRYIKTGEL